MCEFVQPNPTKVFPANQTIFTQFPQDVVVMRIALTAIVTACVVAKIGLAWSWPVVVLGSGFALYTAFEHLIKKDPLVEAFYQIVGGKENYNNLPFLDLTKGNPKISDSLEKLKYDDLKHSFYRATTSDGRKVLIIKDGSTTGSGTSHAINAYVEKISAYDVFRLIGNQHEIVTHLFQAVQQTLKNDETRSLSGGSSYSYKPGGSINNKIEHPKKISGTISSNYANALQEKFLASRPRVEELD